MDEISKPENAKHNDDQKLIESQTLSRGNNAAGVNDVALPSDAKAITPQPIRMAAGTHVATLPTCCSHLPAENPRMFRNVVAQRKPNTNITEYMRLSAIDSSAPKGINAFAAANNNSAGK